MCEAGPSSGKGSGLVTVVLAAVVVVGGVVVVGVVVGGGRGVDAVVVELNGVAEVVSCTFAAHVGGHQRSSRSRPVCSALIVRSAAPRTAEMAAA